MSNIDLIVFYDGGCRLCGREINHYRRLKTSASIRWIDITQEPDQLEDFDIRAVDAMAEFHVVDGDGQIHKGAEGFILLWSALPYYRWLSFGCRLFRVQPLLRRVYQRFARWHFQRRCAQGACSGSTP